MQRAPLARKRNLLLCLDAFGTLFRPKKPIERQYAEVARKHGLKEFESEGTIKKLRESFRTAFKEESRKHPNYGKSVGLDASRCSLKLSLQEEQAIPDQIVPELIHRFSSKEGYELFEDVLPFFAMLNGTRAHLLRQPVPPPSVSLSAYWPWERTIVGIITNSDDRIPSILSSFGLKVGPRRVGKRHGAIAQCDLHEDISFVVLSYDAGYEKPDHHVFDAAVWMLEECLAAEVKEGRVMSSSDFDYLMVGDDAGSDYDGARQAGWNALLLDRSEETPGSQGIEGIAKISGENDKQVDIIDDLRKIRFWQPAAEQPE